MSCLPSYKYTFKAGFVPGVMVTPDLGLCESQDTDWMINTDFQLVWGWQERSTLETSRQ